MFANREEAGRLLAERLKKRLPFAKASGGQGIVLAIPRGGVVVGKIIAEELGWPLDVVVVKKIGAPGQRELAIGAVAEGGVKVIDWEMALRLGVEQEWLDKEVKRLKLEVRKRAKIYKTHETHETHESHVLVDDGVATGATVETGIKAVKSEMKRESILANDRYKKLTTQKIILAIPVGARETVKRLKKMVDEVVVLEEPSWFSAVGQFYREFPQVSDEEVIRILKESKKFLIPNI